MSICTACGKPYRLRWTEPDERGRRQPIMCHSLGDAPIRRAP